MVIDKPQSTRVEGASIVMKSYEVELHFSGNRVNQDLTSWSVGTAGNRNGGVLIAFYALRSG
jgi:hypothetical protein